MRPGTISVADSLRKDQLEGLGAEPVSPGMFSCFSCSFVRMNDSVNNKAILHNELSATQ